MAHITIPDRQKQVLNSLFRRLLLEYGYRPDALTFEMGDQIDQGPASDLTLGTNAQDVLTLSNEVLEVQSSPSFAGTVTSSTGTFAGNSADGASAVGVTLKSNNSLANSSAKLVSIKNGNTEKAAFGYNGALTISGVASGSNGITLPPGAKVDFDSASPGSYALYADVNTVTLRTPATIYGGGFYTDGISQANLLLSVNLTPMDVAGNVTDGASAVAVKLRSYAAMANTSAKLVSIQNTTTEKAYFGYNGALTISGVASNSNAITLPAQSRLWFGGSGLDYIYSVNNNIVFPTTINVTNQILCDTLTSLNAGPVLLRGQTADGGSSVGVKISNVTTLSTSGAKIVSFSPDNGSTEKAYVDKDGVVGGLRFTSTAGSGANAFSVTTNGARIALNSTGTAYLYSDSAGIITPNYVNAASFSTPGHDYSNQPLRLGNYYIWVENATGKLRIKNSAPTSDNDGTVVGSQS